MARAKGSRRSKVKVVPVTKPLQRSGRGVA
jgi:hypothetical protein